MKINESSVINIWSPIYKNPLQHFQWASAYWKVLQEKKIKNKSSELCLTLHFPNFFGYGTLVSPTLLMFYIIIIRRNILWETMYQQPLRLPCE